MQICRETLEMADRNKLKDWIFEALEKNNGRSSIVDIAGYIWENYEQELRSSGDLFYTWQYDMRWAAMKMRKQGKLAPTANADRGFWSLKEHN